MTIEKKINGESVTLIVAGRLDTQTAPELENELDSVLSGAKELTFEDGAVKGSDWGTPFESPYTVEDGTYSYSIVGSWSTNHFKFWVSPDNSAVLHHAYASDYGSGLSNNYRYSSTHILVPTSVNIESYYSIITHGNAADGYSTEYFQQYYEYTLSNGEVVTCFFDFETEEVHWNVTLEKVSGEDGKTKGDVVEVKDSEGNSLITMTLDAQHNRHQQYSAKKNS